MLEQLSNIAAPPPSAAGALLERDDLLRMLDERMASVIATGTGHTVLVAGEAGIGKTSFLNALASRHAAHRRWWGACDALQTPHPLAPLYDIARAADVGFDALLRADGNRAALFESVVCELSQVSKPTLMIVEDAHWADEATLDLLKFLGRRIERTGAFLAVSYRDDEVTPRHPLRRVIGELPRDTVTHVDLQRLSPESVEVLARRALQSPAGIYDATLGNPFFVAEILRAGGTKTPRTVADLVLARFARLTPDAQEILHLVSIVPRSIERKLVDTLLPGHPGALEECFNSGLIVMDSGAVHYRHELARIVIEKSMSEPAARSLHGRVLHALELENAAPARAARLAHHATHAGDDAAIVAYAPEAARQATSRGAHREAIAHYRAALARAETASVPDRISWLEAYARECQFTDEFDEAISARERAVVLSRGRNDATREGDNHSELALAYVRVLRSEDADRASLAAIALLEPRGPSLELARAYRVAAHLRFLNRECADAVVLCERAIELAERFGGDGDRAAAFGTLGAALLFTDYAAGRAFMRRGFDLAVAGQLEFMAAIIANNLGSGSGEVFRLHEAYAHLASAVAFARKHDIDSAQTYGVSWLALCEMYLGRWQEAMEHARYVVDGTADRTIARVYALVTLGRLRTRAGDATGDAFLDEALELAGAGNAMHRVAFVRAARAEAAFCRGDFEAAVREASASLPIAAGRGDAWLAGELAYWLHRAGATSDVVAPCSEPFELEIAGRYQEAAAAWHGLGCPYESARSLARGNATDRVRALELFETLGALRDASELRKALRAAAVPGVPRGRRASTKAHPCNLTGSELEVVSLLCQGLKNAEIAQRLCRSVRTIDHHVSSAFSKLGVSNRSDAIALAVRLGIGARKIGNATA